MRRVLWEPFSHHFYVYFSQFASFLPKHEFLIHNPFYIPCQFHPSRCHPCQTHPSPALSDSKMLLGTPLQAIHCLARGSSPVLGIGLEWRQLIYAFLRSTVRTSASQQFHGVRCSFDCVSPTYKFLCIYFVANRMQSLCSTCTQQLRCAALGLKYTAM
jgi:hypothetical protein